jgi:hypothetical protein
MLSPRFVAWYRSAFAAQATTYDQIMLPTKNRGTTADDLRNEGLQGFRKRL